MKLRWLALLLLGLSACFPGRAVEEPEDGTGSPLVTALAQEGKFRESVEAMAPLNLKIIRLPAGDHPSINVGWFNNGAQKLDPNSWLSQGYDGVKFVGAGVDATNVRCTSWDGCTIAVINHNGVVAFQDMTIYSGYDRLSNLGEQNLNKKLNPKFAVQFINVRQVAQQGQAASAIRAEIEAAYPPRSFLGGEDPFRTLNERVAETRRMIKEGKQGLVITSKARSLGPQRADELPLEAVLVRPKWLTFGYQVDLYLKNVIYEGKEAVEHNVYIHGFANKGALVVDCDFRSAGAEGFKVRSDATETAWAGPQVTITIRNCKFADWFQPWSWRGGAAIVLQGCAADVNIERCVFRAGPANGGVTANARTHCIMVSSESNSYDILTGAVNQGFGTGYVRVRECAMEGNSEYDWNNSILRVARNGGSQMAARGSLTELSGIWGQKTTVQLGNIPTGMTLVRWCNTADIKRLCRQLGMSASVESMIPTPNRMVKVSEGLSR